MSDSRSRIELERLESALTDEYIRTLSVLVLVQGVLENGQAHYAYVSIPKDRYEAFKKAEKAGKYDIRDFGSILHHGDGLTPPKDIQVMIEKHYGGSHQFEKEIRAMAENFSLDVSTCRDGGSPEEENDSFHSESARD